MTGPAHDPQAEARLERLLHEHLRPEPLDELSHARMRKAVQAEWQASLAGERVARRRRARAGLAAAVVAAAVGCGWWALRPAAVLGTLQGEPQAAGLAGPALRAGSHVEAAGNLLVALESGGQLRVRAGAALDVLGATRVRLLRGALYVDADGRAAGAPLLVDTPAGIVRHVGTQYEVAIVGGKVRVRVREGRVTVAGREAVGAGEQLLLAADGSAQRQPFAPYDDEWQWLATPAADVPVEGRNAAFLLRWVARETGRKLEFADGRSEAIANDTVLHGSMSGLEPELALRALLATTSLEASIQQDRIVVRARAAASRS